MTTERSGDEHARAGTRPPPGPTRRPRPRRGAGLGRRVRDVRTLRQGAAGRPAGAPAASCCCASAIAALVLPVPAVLACADGGPWSGPTCRRSSSSAWSPSPAARWPTSTPSARSPSESRCCWSTPGSSSSSLWVWLRTRPAPQPAHPHRGRRAALAGLALVLDIAGQTPARPRRRDVGTARRRRPGRLLRGLLARRRRPAAGRPGRLRDGRRRARPGRPRRRRGRSRSSSGRRDVVVAGTTLPWWAAVGELALVAAAFAYLLGTYAARALGATMASFVGLSEVLFAILFAWLLLGELPASSSWPAVSSSWPAWSRSGSASAQCLSPERFSAFGAVTKDLPVTGRGVGRLPRSRRRRNGLHRLGLLPRVGSLVAQTPDIVDHDGSGRLRAIVDEVRPQVVVLLARPLSGRAALGAAALLIRANQDLALNLLAASPTCSRGQVVLPGRQRESRQGQLGADTAPARPAGSWHVKAMNFRSVERARQSPADRDGPRWGQVDPTMPRVREEGGSSSGSPEERA